MVAVIDEPLRDVQGRDARALEAPVREHALVHDWAVVGDVVGAAETCEHVVRIQHRHFRAAAQAVGTQRAQVGESAHEHAGVSEVRMQATDRVRKLVVEEEPAALTLLEFSHHG